MGALTMLVRRTSAQLHLIAQPDHGALTGFLGRQWGGGGFAGPTEERSSVLLAAALHDCGWDELDAVPLFCAELAGPHDFLSHPLPPRLKAYASGAERVAAQDPYAALLVSMHFVGIYNGYFGWRGPAYEQAAQRLVHSLGPSGVASIDAFVAQESARQAALLARLGRSPTQVRLHHLLLQTWDRLSLLCALSEAGETPPERIRWIVQGYPDVPTGQGKTVAPLEVSWREPGLLALRPYPLQQPEAYFDLPVRRLENRNYRDQDELTQAWQAAQPESQRITFVPG